MSKNNTLISFRVNKALKKKLLEEARKEGRTVSNFIRNKLNKR